MIPNEPKPTTIRALCAPSHRLSIPPVRFSYTLVGDAEVARDVLQETNRVLWMEADSFDLDREFLPWAFAVARNQVRSQRKRSSRSRLVFDEDVVAQLADRAEAETEHHGAKLAALASCLNKLNHEQRGMIQRRYQRSESVQDIATSLDRTAGSLAVTLHRLRGVLARCIEEALARGTQA